MSTVIRPELSKKNDYHIPKHRYYELRHFCLQYYDFRQKYLEGLPCDKSIEYSVAGRKVTVKPSVVATEVEFHEQYRDKIDKIEQTAKLTDSILGEYILMAVTEGFTYDQLNARMDIPCSRNEFYKLYRKFFWLLDKERG